MEFLSPIGGIIGLAGFIMLIVALLRTDTEQSFAAFFLWALLDGIATITTIIQHGNFWLALSNAIGSTAITLILIRKKQVSWSWIETMTAFLVVACLVIWYTGGERAGIVASSLAVVIASIPQMIDTFKKPEATPTLVYTIFLIGNILSVIGGKEWTIEERFYQCCGVFLCAVIAGFSIRKK
jgi:uncharacterized membrane protein YgdD (TMEM256/DUF423 family)